MHPTPQSRQRSLPLVAILLTGAALPASLVTAQGKAPLDYKSHAEWRSIQSSQISPDGKWVVYVITSRSGDTELVAREVDTAREIRVPKARTPDLTPDGRYAVFLLPPTQAELDKARQENRRLEEMPRTAMQILELATGKTESIPRVRGFRLPERGGSAIAYQVEAVNAPSPTAPPVPAPPLAPGTQPPAPGTGAAAGAQPGTPLPGGGSPRGTRGGGRPGGTGAPGGVGAPGGATVVRATPAELVVRDLANGSSTSLGNVADYAWTRDGSWLAYTTASSAGGSAAGVRLRRSTDGKVMPILEGNGRFQGLTWSRDGKRLAFLSNAGESAPERVFSIYRWDVGQEKARRVASGDQAGIPAGTALTEASFPRFSRDGERIYLNLTGTARAARPTPATGSPGTGAAAATPPVEPLKVDLWHYRDGQIQPMQKVRAPLDGRRSYLAVIHPGSDRLVPLGGADFPSVDSPERGEYTVGSNDEPYRMLTSWDTGYSDLALIRLKDGRRTPLLKKHAGGASISPAGKYAYYFDRANGTWRVIGVEDQQDRELASGMRSRFLNELWDQPAPAPPHGIAGWTADDRSVVVYDRYDLWEVPLTGGSPRSLTAGEGRRKRITFRLVRTDTEEVTISTDRSLLLSAVSEDTGDTGFYRSTPPASGSKVSAPQMITMEAKRFGPLTKARDADRFLFTLSRFDTYPDVWVAGADLKNPRRISEANPQQAKYRWGKSEMIRYRSRDGKDLRGVLIRPEGVAKDRKVPLLVNMYERMSQNLHGYVTPNAGTSPNLTRYVSHGYAVLLPDIAYRIGDPGESAYDCVIPAVDKAIALGGIDGARVGITGHSWGGYEVSYLVARTDRFRAAVAGAPVVNMTSAYGGVRWQTGMSRAFQYERTQSRIGATPWEARDKFIKNSPLFNIHKVCTPVLILHNDGDGAVPWYQGIEFFSALRRLEREAYLFNYNDQGHGLTDQAATRHWTVHLDEFLDHHLKGTPQPEWMQKGVPYTERGTRDITAIFGSPPRPSATPAALPAEGG